MIYRTLSRSALAGASFTGVLMSASLTLAASTLHWNTDVCNNTGVTADGFTVVVLPPDGGSITFPTLPNGVQNPFTCPAIGCAFGPDGGPQAYTQFDIGNVSSNGPDGAVIDYGINNVDAGVCTHVGADISTAGGCVTVGNAYWTMGGLDQGSQQLPTCCFSESASDWLIAKTLVYGPDGGYVDTLYCAGQAQYVSVANLFQGGSTGASAQVSAEPATNPPMYVSTSWTSSATDPNLTGINGSLQGLAPQSAIVALPSGSSIDGGPDAAALITDGGDGGDGGPPRPVPAMGSLGGLGAVFFFWLAISISSVFAFKKRFIAAKR